MRAAIRSLLVPSLTPVEQRIVQCIFLYFVSSELHLHDKALDCFGLVSCKNCVNCAAGQDTYGVAHVDSTQKGVAGLQAFFLISQGTHG